MGPRYNPPIDENIRRIVHKGIIITFCGPCFDKLHLDGYGNTCHELIEIGEETGELKPDPDFDVYTDPSILINYLKNKMSK
jgi:hypothetical protein